MGLGSSVERARLLRIHDSKATKGRADVQAYLGTPLLPFSPSCFGVSLLSLNIRKKMKKGHPCY